MQVQGFYRESGSLELVTQPGGLAQKYTVKDGAGKLYFLDVVNTAGMDRFLYLFDNITDLGSIIVPPFKISAGATLSIENFHQLVYGTGLTVASSSTQTSYTAAGSDFMIRALYK